MLFFYFLRSGIYCDSADSEESLRVKWTVESRNAVSSQRDASTTPVLLYSKIKARWAGAALDHASRRVRDPTAGTSSLTPL